MESYGSPQVQMLLVCEKSRCFLSLSVLTSVSVHFPIIVLYQLFDESTVLVQDLVSHVGNIMKHRLILYLMVRTERQLTHQSLPTVKSWVYSVKRFQVLTHHEVLLQGRPGVHDRD